MTLKTLAAAASGAVLSLAAASSALAQTAQPTTTPAAPAITHGAAVPNLCVFSSQRAVGLSAVGKAVDTRLRQIATTVNSELTAERTAIENEAKTLDAQKATMDQGALEKRAADLQVRNAAWNRKAELRQREVSATEQKALQRVGQEMDPVVRQVYQQRQCGILLDRNAVLVSNPAMDITDAVVTALNAKIQTFTFDRERLDQPAPAAQTRK